MYLTGKPIRWALYAAGLWFSVTGLAQANNLVDLGYPVGLQLTGSEASQSVYFPLPANAHGATLHLSLTSATALTPNASVTVLASGVPLATILDSVANGEADVTIPARFTRGSFLQLTFVANQGVSDLCYSSSVTPAEWTIIQPQTALVPNVSGPQGVGDLWRMASTPLTIALPAKPSLGDIQTALILSTALVERGIAPFFVEDPSNASIVIAPSVGGIMASTQTDSQALPKLIVPNAPAARALVAAATAISSDGQSNATGSYLEPIDNATNTRSFGALGISPQTVQVSQDAQMDLDLPLSELSTNRHLVGLKLYGRGMALPPEQSEIISLEVGTSVIWSKAYTGAVSLNGEKVEIPGPLLSSGAKAHLHFIRLGAPLDCSNNTPLSFTLDDATQAILGEGPPAPIRFAGFSATAGGALPVLTDLPPESLPPALPLLAELLGAAHANPLVITVAGTNAVPTQPFILVSHKGGQVVSIAPIPQPNDTIEIPLPNQQTRVSLPEQGKYTLLQLIRSGNGPTYIPGLWLSPGSADSLKQAALPGDGNIALYNGNSAPATFLTELHGAQLGVTQKSLWAKVLGNWNIELLAACWLFLLALLIIVLMRKRKTK